MTIRFYDDYLTGKKVSRRFLSPFAAVNWAVQSQKVSTYSTVQKHLSKILFQQNEPYHSPYLNKVKSNTAVYVVTGQQLGLLGSPLFTIYKALATVKLSESLNKKFPELTFIPLFWMECEDHDYQEINHLYIWNRKNVLCKIEYSGKELYKQSIKHYRFDATITEVIEHLKTDLIQTEFSDSLITRINNHYQEDINWVDATRDFLHDLLHPTGILFFNPGDAAVKALTVSFFQHWFEKLPEISRAFSQQSSLMHKAGYHNQVSDIAGKSFIHILNANNQREHLYYEGDLFYTKMSGAKFNRDEISGLIHDKPESLSTTVISRPLLQSWLLPTTAYVAGPAEIAYWAQLQTIFEIMALKRPVVYPRLSLILIEPRIKRYLEKNEVQIEAMPSDKKRFLESYFKKWLIKETGNPFLDTREQIDIQFDKIKTYIGRIDKTLLNAAEKSYQNVIKQLDVLEEKMIRASQNHDEVRLKQLEQIHEACYPLGVQQERVLSPVYFLNKYGPAFIDRLYEQADIGLPYPQLIYL
jgi:bacillithiol biosynthesis cysteine-adding enzyme BshC